VSTIQSAVLRVVYESAKHKAAELRKAERAARNAYPNGFMREHTGRLADAHAEAAALYEELRDEYESLLVRGEE
jgi:hypothetical protein